jgi:AcrR family transcriptional regulator
MARHPRQSPDKTRRPYHSPKRAQQAERTRRGIADAARRLFGRHGYGPTTIEAIAAEAEVSVQTVYATFGSKRAVLLSMLDWIEAEADVGALMRAVQEDREPAHQLHAMVAFGARLFGRASDLLAIVRSAGHAEPDLIDLVRAGEQRRREGQGPIVRAWKRAGALRPDLTARQASDILWSLTGEDVYRLLVEQCGWPVNRYQQWLESALAKLLFV